MRIRIKWVTEDVDRHGNVRLYFRRSGEKKIRLPGPAGSPAFAQAYKDAVAGNLKPKTSSAARARPAAGSLHWLCEQYFKSDAFLNLEPSTQRVRRRILDRINEVEGHKPYAQLEPRHIRARRNVMRDRPEAANAVVKALRQVFAFACEDEQINAARNPAKEVAYIKTGSEGWHSWTIEEVETFERRHPVGTKARLALALLLYLGQRRSDVYTFGRHQVRGGSIVFTQFKGRNKKPVRLELPIIAELGKIIEASPTGDMTYLVHSYGRPFASGDSFGNWFRKRCKEAGLDHCSPHGLRKAASARLAELGCTDFEIKAVTGHKTLKEVARYTQGARQKVLARNAMEKFSAGHSANEFVPLQEAETRSGTKSSLKRLKNND